MKIYYLNYYSKTMNPCSLYKEANAKKRHAQLCPGGCHMLPGSEPINIRIQENRPESLLNFVFDGVPLAHWSFLEKFGQERICRELILGRVYNMDNKIIPDWVTFRGRHSLIVRGNTHVSHRKCEVCGRNLYFAMGKRYLYPHPVDDIEIYESDLFGIIVPEWIAIECNMLKPRGVYVDRLEVLSEPLDGLPAMKFW